MAFLSEKPWQTLILEVRYRGLDTKFSIGFQVRRITVKMCSAGMTFGPIMFSPVVIGKQ